MSVSVASMLDLVSVANMHETVGAPSFAGLSAITSMLESVSKDWAALEFVSIVNMLEYVSKNQHA